MANGCVGRGTVPAVRAQRQWPLGRYGALPYEKQDSRGCSKRSSIASLTVASKFIPFQGLYQCHVLWAWIFTNESFQFPYLILIALAFLCGYFFIDVLQYVVSWKLSTKLFDLVSSKPPLPPEAEQIVSKKHRIILDKIFFSKIIFLSTCYCFMVAEIVYRFAPLTRQIQPTSLVGGWFAALCCSTLIKKDPHRNKEIWGLF